MFDSIIKISDMDAVKLQVKVVPGASRSRVAGRYGDGVKVQVSAAPERGKANGAVIEVLANWLDVKAAQIAIISGQTQPRKTVTISGISQETIKNKLEKMG